MDAKHKAAITKLQKKTFLFNEDIKTPQNKLHYYNVYENIVTNK